MIAYGTKVVAGVTPGKGGQKHLEVPVYNTVEEAVKEQNANASIIFVPATFSADAVMEAAQAGIKMIVCISEGIPALDMMYVYEYIRDRGITLIGPNCPGIISPGKCKMGIMPTTPFKPGNVGLISRSGTLTYEAVDQVTKVGYGQSTCIGIGGDPIIGTKFVDALKVFKDDPETRAMVMVGEIGGSAEEEAAEYIKQNLDIPVVGFIAGRTAPPGRRMGHAGAIIAGGKGTADEKIRTLRECGISVAESPADIGKTLKELLN
jgi:succinyl-CoA synthetase alpha subunit